MRITRGLLSFVMYGLLCSSVYADGKKSIAYDKSEKSTLRSHYGVYPSGFYWKAGTDISWYLFDIDGGDSVKKRMNRYNIGVALYDTWFKFLFIGIDGGVSYTHNCVFDKSSNLLTAKEYENNGETEHKRLDACNSFMLHWMIKLGFVLPSSGWAIIGGYSRSSIKLHEKYKGWFSSSSTVKVAVPINTFSVGIYKTMRNVMAGICYKYEGVRKKDRVGDLILNCRKVSSHGLSIVICIGW